jgi:hypothetical protein
LKVNRSELLEMVGFGLSLGYGGLAFAIGVFILSLTLRVPWTDGLVNVTYRQFFQTFTFFAVVLLLVGFGGIMAAIALSRRIRKK